MVKLIMASLTDLSSTTDPCEGSSAPMESPTGSPTCDRQNLGFTSNILDHNYCIAGTSSNLLSSTPSQASPRPLYGGSYCCVVGCRNSTYNKKNGTINFHKFPRDPARRDQWERAVRRSVPGRHDLWRASKSAVICSEHFAFGKKTDKEDSPGYVPSNFPTHCIKAPTQAQKRRLERLKKFHQMRQLNNSMDGTPLKVDEIKTREEEEEEDSQQEEEDSQPEEEDSDEGGKTYQKEDVEDCQEEEKDENEDSLGDQNFEDCNNNGTCDSENSNVKNRKDEDISMMDECFNNKERDDYTDLPCRIFLDYGVQCGLPPISLKTPMKTQAFYIGYVENDNEKSTQVESVIVGGTKMKSRLVQTEKQHVLPFENFTDRQFRAFTGVDKNFVMFLSHRVRNKVGKSCVSLVMKISLLLVKLKINATFAVLAAMFGVCEDTAIKIFYEMLDIVAEESRKNIIWFDRRTIETRMPKSFKEHYANARAIIDCTEIETEIPSDVRENVLSYSHYKARHTLKVLIAVAPAGEITFLSQAYGGRCSDTEITVGSGFLNLIEPGDLILADKGFPSIQTDINKAGGILVMPPFKKGNRQFSEVQNQDGYHCSSVRIHVERAIQRLKRFESLTFVPAHARKNVDKILQIVAFIVNCYTDLIKDD